MKCFFLIPFILISNIFECKVYRSNKQPIKKLLTKFPLLSADNQNSFNNDLLEQITANSQFNAIYSAELDQSDDIFTFDEKEYNTPQEYFKFHSLVFTDCTFKNIHSKSETSCINIFNALYKGAIHINSCRFINCNSVDFPGVINAQLINMSISQTCIAHCYSHCCSMAFQSNFALWCNVSETIFDEVAPNHNRGYNFAFKIQTERALFTMNNLTRCNVKERHCLGCFNPKQLLVYRFISNINCSAKILIAFYIENLHYHYISDSIYCRCNYFQDKNGFLDTDGVPQINNCTFVSCKMLFKVAKENSKMHVGVILCNCSFDIPLSKFYATQYVEVNNVNLISRNEFIIPFSTDYAKWVCATDIPSPTQSPKASPFPTPSLYLTPTFKVAKKNYKAVILWIENIILLIITFITVIIYVKVQMRRKIHEGEDEQLLPKQKQ